MEAFVITLREGMEAALVVGLVLTYLNRSGRLALRRWVYTGLGLAAVASLLAAIGLALAGFDPENEVFEGTLFAVAAVLVFSLVVWMWRASRSLRGQVEGRLDSLTASGTRRQGWGVLVFTFFMIFREGVEIILFLTALSLTAAPDMINLIGGLAGLGLAALFGVLFVKGSVRINMRRFFLITGFVLMVLVARLAAGSLHEFFEVGLLPSTPGLLAMIGFLVRDSTSTIILVALVALPVLSMLPEMRLRPAAVALLPGESGPHRRKRLAAFYQSRRWQTALVSVTLTTVLSLGTAALAMGRSGYRPEPQAVAIEEDGKVHIPTEVLVPGELNLYVYQGSQVDVSFMVIKRDEEDLAVALNACGICPPLGYHQEDRLLICDNCNAPINLETVGLPGGCNPVPLPASSANGEVLIAAFDLDAAQGQFAAR